MEIGVIVYNRGACRLSRHRSRALADECPNLVGFKDGIGDIELMVSIRRRSATASPTSAACRPRRSTPPRTAAMGVPVYSSAVFNFIPKPRCAFYRALAGGDLATVNALLDDFFLPYIEIRNRGPGYAVSIVKAGARIVGHGAGPVRPPLTDLLPAELEELDALIRGLGPQ